MHNRTIVSPFYLEEPVERLVEMAPDDWTVQRPVLTGSDVQARLSQIHAPLALAVDAALREGERPVVLSGDCCVTIPVVAGLQRAGLSPTLIWFDAHGDFNTWETSPSGFLGGMPLAMIAGRGEMRMPEAVGMTPLAEEDIILVDARNLDREEQAALEASKVVHVKEAASLFETALPGGPLYVHFDTDILPAEEAPAMNYPVPGGPNAAIMQSIFTRPAATERVVAASMSAWNPVLDEDGGTEQVCLQTFNALVG